MNTIYLITISSNVYIPYFRRNGPITTVERVTKTLLDSFKNMGYEVNVVGTEGGTLNTPVVEAITQIIPATLTDISEKLSVSLVEEASIDTEEDTETDETIEESEEDTDTEEEVEEESTDLTLPSKAELNKMNVSTLINTLTVFIESIDDQYLPLEGKTKKQLLDIASTIAV